MYSREGLTDDKNNDVGNNKTTSPLDGTKPPVFLELSLGR